MSENIEQRVSYEGFAIGDKCYFVESTDSNLVEFKVTEGTIRSVTLSIFAFGEDDDITVESYDVNPRTVKRASRAYSTKEEAQEARRVIEFYKAKRDEWDK